MKKTNKENPITFFRKANEARQAVVKKSLKKAQDGIEMNDDMINKAGSTGGYKKPMEKGEFNINNYTPYKKYMPWEGPAELQEPRPYFLDPTDPRKKLKENATPDTTNYAGPQALRARMAAMKQKKGGSVYKKGGATKATKFAALAPPYNKATAADRIVGAKKNAKKK